MLLSFDPPWSTVTERAADDATSRTALAILSRLESAGFAGWDPYDGLNARALPRWASATPRRRQVVTQLLKRAPNSVRSGLSVPKGVSSYTLGHVLCAYARLHTAGLLPDAAAQATNVLRMLEAASVPGWSGACWGYHFDVQTRFFFYDRSTPNAIVTSFVAKGLAEATLAGLIDGRPLLAGACEFVLRDLPRVESDAGVCFGYIPTSNTVVHNANALCALTLAVGATVAEQPTLDEALRAARFTASYQHEDGSWDYSEQADGRWIDGFHTGFTVEGLHAAGAAAGDDALLDAVGRGLNFYVERLFDADGGPRYYVDNPLPYDTLSAAQGIEVLSTCAFSNESAQAMADKVTSWSLRNLTDGAGRVAYRKHRLTTDRREFPRWSAAPLGAALAGRARP